MDKDPVLKPCPFCGGKGYYINCGDNVFYVRCYGCGCITQTALKKKGAAEKWNARDKKQLKETIVLF